METIKQIIKVIAFIIIGIILFSLLNPIFIPKTSNRTIIQGFYAEPKKSLDVVFVGDSAIYRGITPIKIWQEYGITSYNFASPTQRLWDSYYCVKEILKYQKPKVIVLHADAMFNTDPKKEAFQRHLYDNMPISMNKLQAISNPLQEISKQKAVSFLFPILKYHSRWNELKNEDFTLAYTKAHNALKGYDMQKAKKPYQNKEDYMKMEHKNKNNKIKKGEREYFIKIKELCDKNNIQLVLLETPSPKVWNEKKQQEAQKLAKETNTPFVDMNTVVEQIGIDWEEDTSDNGWHLNIYGAEKASSYFGKYLKENYALQSHKNDKNYAKWEQDSKEYEKQKQIGEK